MIQVGDIVKCISFTSENIEKLSKNTYYTVKGIEVVGDTILLAVVGKDKVLKFAQIDCFERVV
jgi:hypothetical protein